MTIGIYLKQTAKLPDRPRPPHSTATICSGLYFFMGMTGLPPPVDSLSFHLVQIVPVWSFPDARFAPQGDNAIPA